MPGGKQKQAQRTKGNVRPSSSARAAELLESSSGATGGFIGFGALSDLGYVPAMQGNEDVDASVDSDFRMTLRKLSKRDSTTKMKALQEFSTFCQEKDVEAVKTVLPYWPRVYGKLCIDHDRRVREATQQAFEELVLRVRRNLAPHIKSIMGPWLVAECDLYAPAASAAKSAFQAAFPPAKQTEAVLYCKNDALMYIQENLLKQTPQTLSDPKTTDPEDMESKYQRLLACSLLGWKLLLATVPADQQQSLYPQATDILKEGKFWKLAKHQNPMIKGSFYSLLAGLCQYSGELATQYADKICPIVLHNLDESDPAICPNLWEAALYTVTTIQDCWKKVNPRKGVLPKLWSMLRAGGSGCATLIYPNLLPLLSQIPPEVIGEGVGFYQELFNNIKTGLSLEKVQVSPSEVGAIIHALMECLRYCLLHHQAHDTQQYKALQEFLVHEQFLPLLEASFVDSSAVISSSPLYSHTIDLLLFLHKTAEDGRDPEKQQEASSIQQALWSSIHDTCVQYVQSSDASNSHVIQRISTFLVTFKAPSVVNKKKSRVKFSEEDTVKTGLTSPSKVTKSPQELDDSNSPLLEESGQLYGIIYRSSREAYNKSKNFSSKTHLTFFSKMISTFVNKRLIKEIYMEEKEETDDEIHPEMVFRDVLMPWIGRYTKIDFHTSRSLVDILYSVFALSDSAARLDILSSLYQDATQMQLLEQFAHKTLNSSTDAAVARWFRGGEFGGKILAVTRELCDISLRPDAEGDDQDEARWSLLRLALSTDHQLEPVVGPEYMDGMLMEIRAALPTASSQAQLSNEQLNRCVVFVCDVATMFYSNIKGCLMLGSAEELLLALFQLSCQHNLALTEATQGKVWQSWQLGLKALLHQKGGLLNEDGFLNKAATHIRFRVLNDGHSIDRLVKLSGLGLQLAETMAEHLAQDEGKSLQNASVAQFTKQLHLPFMHPLITQWISGPMVEGVISFESESLTTAGKTPLTTVPKCVAPIVFTSQVLRAVWQSPSNSEVIKDTEGPKSMDISLLSDMAYGIAFCKAVMGIRRKALSQTEIGSACTLLEGNFKFLLSYFAEENRKDFVERAITKSLSEGFLWSLTLDVILEYTCSVKWNMDLSNMAAILDKLSILDEATVQTVQVTLTHLPKSELGPIVEILAAQILSAPQDRLTHSMGARGFLSIMTKAIALQESPLGDSITGGSYINHQVVLGVLTEIEVWRGTYDGVFAFECEVHNMTWGDVMLNVQMMKLLQLLVAKIPTNLADHWDFILCSMVSWMQSLHESREHIQTDSATQTFMVGVLELVTSVAGCMRNIAPVNPDTFPASLHSEWLEFFSEATYGLLLPIFISVTNSVDLGQPSVVEGLLLRALGSATSLCPLNHIKAHKLTPRLVADHDTNLPDGLQTVVNHLCPLLLSPNRATQLAAYRMLLSLMTSLPEYDIDKEREEDKDKEEITRSPPVALLAALETSVSSLEGVLEGLKVGEHLVPEPFTEEYSFTCAYLLSWRLLLAFFKAAPSELKAQYVLHLRDSGMLDGLLHTLLHLMPETPLIQMKDALTSHTHTHRLSSTRNLFSEPPLLDPTGYSSSLEAQHLACMVYHGALQELPAAVRQWWNAQDKKTASIVDRFTSKFVSPILCSQDFMAIQEKEVESENLSVKVRPTAREVVATYTVQEFSMELLVTLSPNHPLGPISVESGKRIGVTNTQWRNWMLQMTTFLTHQNGSIFDGLMLWKKNVDKRFEGLDDCMICFSVIHNSNYQLPKLTCRVCKKRFHSACLYKWFSTSNNSSCPMCRSLF